MSVFQRRHQPKPVAGPLAGYHLWQWAAALPMAAHELVDAYRKAYPAIARTYAMRDSSALATAWFEMAADDEREAECWRMFGITYDDIMDERVVYAPR